MDPVTYKLIGAGIAMIGALGAGIGLGLLFSSWLQGISRNPQAADKLNVTGYIGFAATELVLLLCFVMSFLIFSYTPPVAETAPAAVEAPAK